MEKAEITQCNQGDTGIAKYMSEKLEHGEPEAEIWLQQAFAE